MAADPQVSDVRRLLKRQGFRVFVTEQPGADARTQPDLILVDIRLPQMAVELKRLEAAYPGIPVLLMTARVRNAPAKMSYRARAGGAETAKARPIAAEMQTDYLSARPATRALAGGRGLAYGIVPAFHDGRGRLNARAIARAFGVSMSQLARSLGITPSALSKRATAEIAQAGLRELEFVWVNLNRMLGADDLTRAWLNAAHPDLAGRPPLVYLTDGKASDLGAWIRGSLLGEHG